MAQFSVKLDQMDSSSTGPTLQLGRLHPPLRQSRWKAFLSNFRDFLFERPVKVRGGLPTAFVTPGFGAGVGENFKELFHASPRLRAQSNSVLLVNWNMGFDGFWRNLRDAVFPRKIAPLKVSSKPVPVPEIWSKNTQFTRVQALSIAFHALVLVLIIAPLLPGLISPPITQAKTNITILTDESPYLPKLPPAAKKAGGGGGGGEHNPIAASKGRLPKPDWTRFTPPAVKPPENPRLAMMPTILAPPDLKLPSPNMPNWGDPLSKVINDSSGPGSGAGIGSGSGGGVGSGSGGGVGPGEGWGAGGGAPSAGTGGYGIPACLYCPNPQFSDEAVKAKYQGTVTLVAIITPDGRATDIHVVKGLGLGLDEKAIEAVRQWRFRPATGPDGRPAAVRQIIEAVFHLY
jgi:periplasmic protein TonB